MGALKGVHSQNQGIRFPTEATSFRTSAFIPEGLSTPVLVEARILDLNLVNWTVDCVTQFDQRYFFDIQVAAPYLHANLGEGIYAFPEVGAKCIICITSDGSAPFVLSFIMPMETLSDSSSDQAPEGTNPENSARDYTYRGGRPAAKPGDIVMRGRDGNFVILHRGGVLQVGSSQLSQRVYIPLTNLITDISQNYNHFNTGGSINWGLRPGSPEANPETEYRQTFRVFANDEFADVRVAIGKVHRPVLEPVGDEGSTSDLEQLQIGTEETIVTEFVIAPGGFDSGNGLPQEARDKVKFRMFWDAGGNGMLRCEGSLSLRVKEKLRLRVDDDFEVFGQGVFNVTADKTIRLEGKKGVDITTGGGGVLKINGGTKPVASVGSVVNIVTTIPVPIQTSMGPGTILAGAVFQGNVTTGNPTVLV